MRKTVTFTKTDGRTPERFGDAKVFSLLAPLDFNLPAGTDLVIDLGISSSHPMTVFAAGGPLSQGVVLLNPGTYDAKTPLRAHLKNTNANGSVFFGIGEAVARAAVVSNEDVHAS